MTHKDRRHVGEIAAAAGAAVRVGAGLTTGTRPSPDRYEQGARYGTPGT
jgi:hypothetical protein